MTVSKDYCMYRISGSSSTVYNRECRSDERGLCWHGKLGHVAVKCQSAAPTQLICNFQSDA